MVKLKGYKHVSHIYILSLGCFLSFFKLLCYEVLQIMLKSSLIY